MTIRFFSRKDCKGKSTIVNSNLESFSTLSTLGSTASVELTSSSDKILLFKKTKWNGEVLFLDGKQTVQDIGDDEQGGKKGFRNSVNSARVTPFEIRVKFHVITDNQGTLPRGNPSKQGLESFLGKTRILASNIWEDEALIRLTDGGIVYTQNQTLFNAKCGQDMINEEFPNLKKNKAHVFIVNTINKLGCAGVRASNPGFFVASGEQLSISDVSRTLAHELGHSLGLGHGKNTDGSKLMTQTGNADPTDNTNIGTFQVEKTHEALSDKKGDEADYRQE